MNATIELNEKTEVIEIIDFSIIEYAQDNLLNLVDNGISSKVIFLKTLREKFNISLKQNMAVYDYLKAIRNI